MRTLIIPCAGSRMVDNLPLFLNVHPDGSLLAQKAIQGIFCENYDRIIYTVLKDAEDEYGASETIRNAFGNSENVEVVVLEEKTGGPAETVYKTLIEADVQGEFVVRDSHAYIELESDFSGNFVAGLDLTEYEKTIENLRSKSFIVLNEQRKVLDVVEKHFCSDVISAGVYGFASANDYKMAYERLSDPNYPIKKLYLSHMISYLIGYKQRVFHSVKVTKFEDWSTKSAWQKVQKSYATCFIDIDVFGGDCVPYDERVISKLRKMSASGIRFIGFSSNNICVQDVLVYLRENNIQVLEIVTGCTCSKVRTVVLNTEELDALALEVK